MVQTVSVEKPEATYRIITLGDSFTMGKGVEDDQTFSFRLQELLSDELGRCEAKVDRIEVLNAGVDSYSPLLSYLYLSRELVSLDPDLVIFNLDNSDLVQEAAYRSVALRNDNGRNYCRTRRTIEEVAKYACSRLDRKQLVHDAPFVVLREQMDGTQRPVRRRSSLQGELRGRCAYTCQ